MKIVIQAILLLLHLFACICMRMTSSNSCSSDLSFGVWELKNGHIYMTWPSNQYYNGSCGHQHSSRWKYLYKNDLCSQLESSYFLFIGDSHSRHFFGGVVDLLSGYIKEIQDITGKVVSKDFAVPDKF